MTYVPNNQTAGSFKVNYTSPWHEEMRTSDRTIGATISERITSARDIKKETKMQGSSMAILGEFNGTAEIKAVQQTNPKGKENLRVEQTFTGRYKLDTAISINKGPTYLKPHLNVTKKALKQDETTVLFRINVTNDGNKTLGPIYVTDVLPEGLTFINSSLRPDAAGNEVRWSLISLQIGGKQSITIRARINETASRFINRVNVSALYSGGVVNASAACGFVLDWLPCCLIERVPAKKVEMENASPYSGQAWAPPKFVDMMSNVSEYPLDKDIPCSSCLLDLPENG
jgi:uncharacterized repeat protein (TIGR01451 family)